MHGLETRSLILLVAREAISLNGTKRELGIMLVLTLLMDQYSWSNEARARQALANILALLQPAEGLEFGNSFYWVSFDEDYQQKQFPSSRPFGIKYKFHLENRLTSLELRNEDWINIASTFWERTQEDHTVKNLQLRFKTVKKKFFLLKELTSRIGWSWDAEEHKVIAPIDNAWDVLVASHGDKWSFIRNMKFPWYDMMYEMIVQSVATLQQMLSHCSGSGSSDDDGMVH